MEINGDIGARYNVQIAELELRAPGWHVLAAGGNGEYWREDCRQAVEPKLAIPAGRTETQSISP